ncbi:acyltransferase family protein [Acidisoma sp.]|uniref:acyltransferase family protein n=1 Tax=Acidisoma sp. TaxID=1872115 RepID=UPI003B00EB65
MLRAEGRPDFLKLYIGRIFRIIPLYVFLAGIVFAVVGVLTHWNLQVSPIELLKEMVRWLSGGILPASDVNGHNNTFLISAGVTWSLQFEWFFYASLLVIAFFARNRLLGILLPILGYVFVGVLKTALHLTSMDASAALMFFIGMIAASAKSTEVLDRFQAPQWAMSSMIIILVAFVLFFSTHVFGIASITGLGLAFILVVTDGTIFGLLLTKGARRLGDISYGIYLLQGPVLFVVFWPAVVRADALSSPWLHWIIVMIAALLLVALATATHVLIEIPGVQAGRCFTSRIMNIRSLRQA